MSLAWNVRVESAGEVAPPGWAIRRVGDLVTLINGYPFSSEMFAPAGDTPLVRIRDLESDDFKTYVTGEVPAAAIVRNGDVVIGMDGDFNVVLWDRGEAALNQRLCLLRPRSGVDIRFVAYSLPSTLKIINDLTFSTTVKHLSSNDILAERLPVPPLEEQRRIADFLDAEIARIDRLTIVLRRTLDALSERRAAGVMAHVSGTLHENQKPVNLGWLTSIPSRWQNVRLGLVARMGSGHTPSRSRPEWWVDRSIPWITTGEVNQVRDDRQEEIDQTREMISRAGLANSAAELHPAGTVVLCRTASAGYSAVMGRDMATSQDFVTWTCGPHLDPYYLLWCLRAMRQDLLGRLAMGSTHQTIYVPDLQMLRIPLPPMTEQRETVTRIRAENERIDRLSDKLSRQLELLTERRQALITAAVTGEFDVSSASGRGVVE